MAVALEVDITELDQRAIRRIVELTCQQCGAQYQYAQLRGGALPRYCAECAQERYRQRARRKEARKVQRRLENLPWMHKRELEQHVAGQGHEPLSAFRLMTCLRCRQALARRRGPARATSWFLEDAAHHPCRDLPD